jgi:hypothetical protein
MLMLAVVNIDDPTPIERQPCSLHTGIRPLLDKFPAGFEQLAKSQKNKILTAKTERQLLNHLLSMFTLPPRTLFALLADIIHLQSSFRNMTQT